MSPSKSHENLGKIMQPLWNQGISHPLRTPNHKNARKMRRCIALSGMRGLNRLRACDACGGKDFVAMIRTNEEISKYDVTCFVALLWLGWKPYENIEPPWIM